MISVIVPVYNSKKYLDRCLKSIINQTYTELEIICIDDGSTDGSSEILERYAEADSRIIVVHQENQGQAIARNQGLKICNGEYIGFVDSDDSIEVDMFEKMLMFLTSNHLDLVFCNTKVVKEDVSEYFNYFEEDRILSSEEAQNFILTDKIGSYPWGKLFRKELWDGIVFPPARIYEDLGIMPKVFFNLKRNVGYLSEPLNSYFILPTSTCNKSTHKQIYGMFLAFEERYELAKHQSAEIVEICLLKAANTALGCINNGYRYGDLDPDTTKRAKQFLNANKKEILSITACGRKDKMKFKLYYHCPFMLRFMAQLKK